MRIDLQRLEQAVDGFLLLALLPQVHRLVEYRLSILAEIPRHSLNYDVLSVRFDDVGYLSGLELQRRRGPHRVELACLEIPQIAPIDCRAVVNRIGPGK